jgi:hypothetical protein
MRLSTSHRTFSERWPVAALVGLIIVAPAIWLVLLQTNYVLSYAACGDRTNAWLTKPAAVALLAGVVVFAAAWSVWARFRSDAPPRPFLGALALGLSLLSFILLVATAVPPLILHPCD